MTGTGGSSVGAIRSAVALTFGRPDSWVVAAAGFLARGGIVLLALPILVLPTAAETSTLFGPLISRFVTGSVDGALLAGLGLALLLAAVVVVALLLVGGAVDGWMIAAGVDDTEGSRAAAVRPGTHSTSSAASLAATRAFAFLPLVAVLAVAGVPIVSVATEELLRPADLATPVTIRVMARLAWLVGLVAVAAALCDMVAALATRAVALDGLSIARSYGAALRTIRRRPATATGVLAFTLVLALVILLPALVALAAASGGVRALVANGSETPVVILGVLILVGCWIGALVLAGIAAALRSFAWTCVHAAGPTTEPAGQQERLLAP